MRIIFEGPDKAGKTTLSKGLSARLNLPRRSRILRTSRLEVVPKHFEDLAGCPEAIFDRCYAISDLIYEPIMTGEPSVFYRHGLIEIMEHHLMSNNIIIVYVTGRLGTIQARYRKDPDDILTIGQVEKAWMGYENYFRGGSLKHIRVDTTRAKPRTALEYIIKEINKIA